MESFTAETGRNTAPNVTLCVNLCEVVSPSASVTELESLMASTCHEAGFPYYERIYVGSYFCENYFLGLPDHFHEVVRNLCARHELAATLVVPIVGQAFYNRAVRYIAETLIEFSDVYDEVVVNDVAQFFDLQLRLAGVTPEHDFGIASAFAGRQPQIAAPRLGLGRLFSKELRDARYVEMRDRTSMPALSAEAAASLSLQKLYANASPAPLVEVDPTSAIVDVSNLINDIADHIGPNRENASVDIAIHLPYCYATTGRNCSMASAEEPDSEKFRIGRGCSHHCLRISQGYLTDENARYVKHGRTYYFANPACSIAGTNRWRIVYAATHETMR